jgi:hypothetical protein
VHPSSYRGGEEGDRLAEALGTLAHLGWVSKLAGRNVSEARAGLESSNVSADLPSETGKAAGSRRSNRPMMERSLTGVVGVARQHRTRRNTGSPALRGVATLISAYRRKPRWVSEGRTVPLAPAGQQNRSGGKAPWFGVGFNGPRGGRLA